MGMVEEMKIFEWLKDCFKEPEFGRKKMYQDQIDRINEPNTQQHDNYYVTVKDGVVTYHKKIVV